jgi:hypothetical protein
MQSIGSAERNDHKILFGKTGSDSDVGVERQFTDKTGRTINLTWT